MKKSTRATIMVSITMPSDWVAVYKVASAAKGMTLSAWIGQACNKQLPKETRSQLSERVSRGKPRKDNAAE